MQRHSISVARMEADRETKRDEGGSVSRTDMRVGRVQVPSVCRACDRGGKSHVEQVRSRLATHCAVAAPSGAISRE